MSVPNLSILFPVNNVTNIDAAFMVNLQNNIVTYVSQFLPLVGGQLAGALLWDPSQVFPSYQVQISNPTTYQQTGFYNILDDHINDPIHGAPVQPLDHAFSHEIGGSDLLYGSMVYMVSGNTQDIKSYVDTKVASVTGSFYSGPTASSYYEIGGTDPLYGNLIAIDSSHPSLDIETFVNNSVAAAIATGVGSNNPTFNTVTLSSGVFNTSNGSNLSLSSQGAEILSTDGTITQIFSPTNASKITFGQSGGTGVEYGYMSSNGYAVGSSIFGPTGMISNGPSASNNDLTVNRSANSQPTQGAIFMGNSGLAYFSYNADVPNEFFFSQPVTAADDINIDPGAQLNVGGAFYIGPNLFNSIAPGISSDGANLHIYAKDNANIYIGYDNSNLSAAYFGPLGTWGKLAPNGLTIGSTNVSASGATIAGTVIVNSAYVSSTGDLGVARGASAGKVFFGQSNSTGAYLSYGVEASATYTFGINNTTVNGGILSQIKSDGTYSVGGSLYGPTGATVNGAISAAKSVSAPRGIDNTGNSGFTFGTDYTTGLFSNGSGDIRLVANSSKVFGWAAGTGTFTTNVAVSGAFTSYGNSVFGTNVSIAGNLSLSGDIQAVGTTISQFRTKSFHELYFTTASATTGTATKQLPMPNFSGGQIEKLWITCTQSDNLITPTTFTIYKNGVAIGTVALPAGQLVGSALPIVNPTPVSSGDIIHAVVTQGGGAIGTGVYIENSQLVY